MKELTLAKAIDRAALIRAESILRRIKVAVDIALKPHWRPSEVCKEFIGKEVKRVLAEMSKDGDSKDINLRPTTDLVDMCREAIVNEMMNGMENLRVLNKFAQEAESQEMPIPAEE